MIMTDNAHSPHFALLHATAQISAAFITAHKTPLNNVYDVIDTIYNALDEATSEYQGNDKLSAHVDIDSSITPEYLICLEDGKKLKMLKRYLKTNFDMTPEEYRKRWNLPPDYPMVAPNYAKRRSQLAKDIGLGKQSIKQQKAAAFNKMKNNLPMGKGRLRILRSTDIMTTRPVSP